MSIVNRQPFVDSFADAAEWGEYDEVPVLPEETDPQVYVSRNTKPQPFYLVCEKDSLVVFMTGEGEVLLKHPDVRRFRFSAGDYVYVPARTPHRILPSKESIVHRFKARVAGAEAVTWYCEHCDAPLSSHTWKTDSTGIHQAYLQATEAFNASTDARTCKSCGQVHPVVDVSGNRWRQLAEELGAKE